VFFQDASEQRLLVDRGSSPYLVDHLLSARATSVAGGGMYDLAFTQQTLRQQVRRVDFINFPHLRAEGELDLEIAKAIAFVRDPTSSLSRLKTQRIGSAKVRVVTDYHLLLSLRKLNANIGFCARRQSKRTATSSSALI
jgi:hypothetical protein